MYLAVATACPIGRIQERCYPRRVANQNARSRPKKMQQKNGKKREFENNSSSERLRLTDSSYRKANRMNRLIYCHGVAPRKASYYLIKQRSSGLKIRADADGSSSLWPSAYLHFAPKIFLFFSLLGCATRNLPRTSLPAAMRVFLDLSSSGRKPYN